MPAHVPVSPPPRRIALIFVGCLNSDRGKRGLALLTPLGFTATFLSLCGQDLAGTRLPADFDFFRYYELIAPLTDARQHPRLASRVAPPRHLRLHRRKGRRRLARAAMQAGHELVNHAYTHPHLKTLDDMAVRSEIADTHAAILITSGQAARWFWPTYLECDERIESIARDTGAERFPMARFHLVSTQDWNRATDAATIRRLDTEETTHDSVILCHEWREETWAELPTIIAELRTRGCEFVTFSSHATPDRLRSS